MGKDTRSRRRDQGARGEMVMRFDAGIPRETGRVAAVSGACIKDAEGTHRRHVAVAGNVTASPATPALVHGPPASSPACALRQGQAAAIRAVSAPHGFNRTRAKALRGQQGSEFPETGRIPSHRCRHWGQGQHSATKAIQDPIHRETREQGSTARGSRGEA